MRILLGDNSGILGICVEILRGDYVNISYLLVSGAPVYFRMLRSIFWFFRLLTC